MDNNNKYEFDTEALETAKSQLQQIEGVVTADLKIILTELKGIDVDGEPKQVLINAADALANSLGKISMPGKIGDSLGQIASSLGMQEANVAKAFSGWGEAFAGITQVLKGGVASISNLITNVPEGAENYSVAQYASDVTKTTVGAAVDLTVDSVKLYGSFTGQTLETGLSQIMEYATPTMQKICDIAVKGTSAVLNLFRR